MLSFISRLYRPLWRDAQLGLNYDRRLVSAAGSDTASEVSTAVFHTVPDGYVDLLTQVDWFATGGGSQQARTWWLRLTPPRTGLDTMIIAGGQACLSVADIYDHQLCDVALFPGDQLTAGAVFNGGTSSNTVSVYCNLVRIPKANYQTVYQDL